MGTTWLTADWHIGEKAAWDTASYLRPRPTEVMVEEWLADCHDKLRPDDTLIMVGDMVIASEYIATLSRLPHCHKVFITGDKEQRIGDAVVLEKLITRCGIHVLCNQTCWPIADRDWFITHKPSDCLEQSNGLPALCGHVHGAWRTSRMPNSRPIINVGIDAWGGLVSEAMIAHQYDCVTKGYYDKNCFPQDWENA